MNVSQPVGIRPAESGTRSESGSAASTSCRVLPGARGGGEEPPRVPSGAADRERVPARDARRPHGRARSGACNMFAR